MDSWVAKAVGIAIASYVTGAVLLRGFDLAVSAMQAGRAGFQIRAAQGGVFELVETVVHRLPTTAVNVARRGTTISEVNGVPQDECSLWGNFEYADKYAPKHRGKAVADFGTHVKNRGYTEAAGQIILNNHGPAGTADEDQIGLTCNVGAEHGQNGN